MAVGVALSLGARGGGRLAHGEQAREALAHARLVAERIVAQKQVEARLRVGTPLHDLLVAGDGVLHTREVGEGGEGAR